MEKAFHRTFVLGDPPEYEPGPERSLAGLAAARGVTPLEVAYDEMARDGGQGLLYIPILNYATGNLDHVREMMLHPQGLLGLADGGAHTGTICDASMPTFMLTHWTRDRSRGETLPLEYVVKKQTHDTARLYGLSDRGTVEPGALADLNLIDYEGLSLGAPYVTADLPAGGRRLLQKASGYVATIKGGTVTFEQGAATGELPGRLVRGAALSAAGTVASALSLRSPPIPVAPPAPPARQTAPRMDAPLTQYALRDGVHLGYQVWGPGVGAGAAVDVLEFNSGLMISIDEAVDEPNWLRYTQRVAEFARLIRFDAGGLGLSDPLPAGTDPSIEGWGRDALAVMDAAGCASAVLLAPTGGALAALWLAATHPERVSSLVVVNGTARVGQAEDYGFGVSDEEVAEAANIDVPLVEGDVPQDIAVFAPSLAHRVGFREWWERAARRGASPATAIAFNLVTFSADMRGVLPDISCPTLVIARTGSYANLSEHGRYLAEHIAGAALRHVPGTGSAPLGRRVRLHRRRGRGVRDRRAWRARAHPHAGHGALHRHRGLHGACRRGGRPPVARRARRVRCQRRPSPVPPRRRPRQDHR